MRLYIILFSLLCFGCNEAELFPEELIDFNAYDGNPVFSGTGDTTWDEKIRERGFIIKDEDGTWKLWYTGYKDGKGTDKYLGLATSQDGINWQRYADTPIYDKDWVEDVFVYKKDDTYFMFAEGRNDIPHLLTSKNGILWQPEGRLDVRKKDGSPIAEGPYGTPTVWHENDLWHLFYERNDSAVWLATSKDMKVWTNVDDNPVLEKGPDTYDLHAVALNQIIRHNGKYYAYYHASAYEDWREWSTCIAVSDDLINWKKYNGNPIMQNNTSSGIVVHDGAAYRLYTMHPSVQLFVADKKTTVR